MHQRQPELDPEAVYRAADQKRRGLRISWREVARQAQLSGTSVFKQLGRGKTISVANLLLVLLWIGRTDLALFVKPQAARDGESPRVSDSGQVRQ